MAEQPALNERPSVTTQLPQKKRGIIKRFLLVLIVLVLICGLVVGGVLLYKGTRKPDCAALTSEATQLMKKNKYPEAYTDLRPHYDDCGSNQSSPYSEILQARLEYDYRLAVSAFKSGHKSEAKTYAQEGLAIRNQLVKGSSPFDQTQDQQNTGFDLLAISRGSFVGYRTLK